MASKKTVERAAAILKVLNALYPQVKPQLLYRSPFELLVATILSAQCTDNQVNRVTPVLFKRMRRPRDFVKTPVAEIEGLVRPTGFYRNKARNIKACCEALVGRHGGHVPRTLEELVELPGVGRKTANVVLGAAFNTPGVVVDTHVGRISGRLGLTKNKDPEKIERDLMRIIPRNEWSDFSLRLIFFGRATCTARKPKCPVCPLSHLCPYPHKTPKSPA
ncbi:MAG TPA: endonuclease III [Desulfobacterales bacterium]|nr:endonuclease III [Desulfobacterales bacterium]